jgi:hypothetical protein
MVYLLIAWWFSMDMLNNQMVFQASSLLKNLSALARSLNLCSWPSGERCGSWCDVRSVRGTQGNPVGRQGWPGWIVVKICGFRGVKGVSIRNWGRTTFWNGKIVSMMLTCDILLIFFDYLQGCYDPWISGSEFWRELTISKATTCKMIRCLFTTSIIFKFPLYPHQNMINPS